MVDARRMVFLVIVLLAFSGVGMAPAVPLQGVVAPAASTPISELVRDLASPTPLVKILALRQLSQRPDEAADFSVQIASLLTSGNAVALEACETLKRLGPKAAPAIAALVGLLGGKDASAQMLAARALSTMAPGPEIEESLMGALSRALTAAKAHSPSQMIFESVVEANVAADVATAIATLYPGSRRGVDLIEDALRRATSKPLLVTFAGALGQMGDGGVEALGRCLAREGASRVPIVKALAQKGSGIGRAIPALYSVLDDRDRLVRQTACQAIRRFRGVATDFYREPCF